MQKVHLHSVGRNVDVIFFINFGLEHRSANWSIGQIQSADSLHSLWAKMVFILLNVGKKIRFLDMKIIWNPHFGHPHSCFCIAWGCFCAARAAPSRCGDPQSQKIFTTWPVTWPFSDLWLRARKIKIKNLDFYCLFANTESPVPYNVAEVSIQQTGPTNKHSQN